MAATDGGTRRSILLMAGVIVIMGCSLAVMRNRDDPAVVAAPGPPPAVPAAVLEPEAAPATPQPPAPEEATSLNENVSADANANDNATPADPFQVHIAIQHPTDEQSGWIRIVDQSLPRQSSTLDARYEPKNEFRLTTHNVEQLRIDQAQLPVNKRKPFIIHLDGQDMAVNPPEQGMVTFRRNANGIWEYLKP